jgi:hypothetical protein
LIVVVVIVAIVVLLAAVAIGIDRRDKRGSGTSRPASVMTKAAVRNRERFARRRRW